MANYAPLFTIVTEHGFYEDGVAHGLSFIPTEGTTRVMGNAGLLVKPVVGGIMVMYDKKDIESLQLYAGDKNESLNLVFKVITEDAAFKSRTDASLEADDSILFFDSRGREEVVDERIKLHDNKYVSMIDLTRLDSDQLTDVLSHREKRLPPLFVVNIHVSEKDLNSVDSDNEVVPKHYFIRLKEREVFWKYYLLGRLARESVYLSDLDSSAEFVFSGREIIGDRREAMTFRTTKKLSLKASPNYRFQLREKDNGGDKVIIKRLPMAEVTRLGRDVIDGSNEVVSEIYINC